MNESSFNIFLSDGKNGFAENSIYKSCSVDLMKQWDDECIDLTVTSPPYEDFRKYNGFTFDLDETIKQLYRVTKQGGVVVWVIGDKTKNGTESGNSFRHALKFIENGWLLNDTMIWVKMNPMPTEASCRYKQTFEYMFVFSKGKPKTFNPLMEVTKTDRKYKSNWGRKDDYMISSTGSERKTAKQKVKGNVFYYPISVGGATKDKFAFEHPAIFPEQLAEDHILTWSNEGDIVFDCFCGSGTTLKMAKLNNRKSIGCDISEKYCLLSLKRVGEKNIKTDNTDEL
jgi:DNA modification methylase